MDARHDPWSPTRACAPTGGRRLEAFDPHAILPPSCACSPTCESDLAESGPAVSEYVCSSADHSDKRATCCRPVHTASAFFLDNDFTNPRHETHESHETRESDET